MGGKTSKSARITKPKKSIDLYHHPVSAPSRAVQMVCKAHDIPVNIKVVDLFKGEQNNPDFIKMNPCHCVPTIDDSGFILWEGLAIVNYILDKYCGGESKLYPKNPEQRAAINRMLCHDLTSLYPAMMAVALPKITEQKEPDEEATKKLDERLQYIDDLLSKDKYLCGSSLTLADVWVLAKITFLDFVDYPYSKFSHVWDWVERLKKELPYYTECSEGMMQMKEGMANNST